METEVIKLLISSYFSLSKRTLIDMVPKGTLPSPPPFPSAEPSPSAGPKS